MKFLASLFMVLATLLLPGLSWSTAKICSQTWRLPHQVVVDVVEELPERSRSPQMELERAASVLKSGDGGLCGLSRAREPVNDQPQR